MEQQFSPYIHVACDHSAAYFGDKIVNQNYTKYEVASGNLACTRAELCFFCSPPSLILLPDSVKSALFKRQGGPGSVQLRFGGGIGSGGASGERGFQCLTLTELCFGAV